jgi:hypothetical protein
MANKTQKQYAEDWGVKLVTWNKWKEAGAPVGNEKKLAFWLRTRQRLNKRTREKMAEVGVNSTAKSKRNAKAEEIDAKAKTAEDFRNHYKAQLDKCIQDENGDPTEVKFWSELFLKQDESIRRNELHAKKLGLQDGTTLSRIEVERILRAVFNAGNTCINDNLTQYCQRWADIHDPAELYHSMKPQLVFDTLFSGFSKYELATGDPHIPEWVSDCVRKEQEQYITFESDE